MRSIRHLLSGLALLLASGCMHISISMSPDDACAPTCMDSCGEGTENCDPCACKPGWWEKFNFISINCERPCDDDCCEEKPGCCSRAWAFLTYRPLCKSMMDEGPIAEVARPRLYTYFQPSKYNKPLQPIECSRVHSWLWWPFCRTDCCDECVDGACGASEASVPVIGGGQVLTQESTYQGRSSCVIYGSQENMQEIAPPLAVPARQPSVPANVSRVAAKFDAPQEAIPEATKDPKDETKANVPVPSVPAPVSPPAVVESATIHEPVNGAPCRPRMAFPTSTATPRRSEVCGAGRCNSGQCGSGTPACPRPKPRLDGLPILPPTMFRRYAPCDGPDATALLAPIPGSAGNVEQLQIAPKPVVAEVSKQAQK